ncbi:MAG: hypothetical protein JWN83_2596 [Chitinophagaceae bacterium]|nr:hypothetical protein [Chitinophagaceae bacterium]
MVREKGVVAKKKIKTYDGLRQKYFGIRDLGKLDESAVRQLHYWLDEKIVSGNDTKGWQKFDFYTFLWILIVREFKVLGLDNNVLIKCSKGLFDGKNQPIKEFENAILTCLKDRKGLLFLLNKYGDFEFIENIKDVPNSPKARPYMTFVVIDITLILLQFLSVKDFYGYIKEHGLLKEREIQVLNVLHEHTNAMVTVKFLKDQVTITDKTDSIEQFLGLILHQGNYKTIDIQI